MKSQKDWSHFSSVGDICIGFWVLNSTSAVSIVELFEIKFVLFLFFLQFEISYSNLVLCSHWFSSTSVTDKGMSAVCPKKCVVVV